MAMASPEFASSENTMEALREFLQSMRRTIERLCEGHALAAMQTSNHENPDTKISYAFGMLPTSGKGFHQPSQNAMGDVAGIFLEDMKKTIEAWTSRYRLLVEGKDTLIRECLDVEAMPQPVNSNVQVMDQLDFGPDADQDFSVMEVLDLPNDREEEALHQSAQGQNRKTQGTPFTQQIMCNKGKERGKLHSQTHQSRTDATAFSMQEFKEVMAVQNPELLPQDMVEAQEPAQSDCHVDHGKMDIKPAFVNDRQPGHNNADHEDMDMEEASTHYRKQGDNNVVFKTEKAEAKAGPADRKQKKRTTEMATPVNNQELTIRRFQYEVEVVDSPEWLPKGWITELKTRGTGGSAGSKDKYYFDPVSKRRFRSQKQVFSFLETGKLGRYKSRPKPQPVKKMTGTETPLGKQANDLEIANKRETPGMRSSAQSQQNAQENTSGPLALSPGAGQMGIVSNMFLPHRPGQPSEWLVYESLENLPRPVLEHFRFTDLNSSKSNGDRGPTWPLFLGNSESSMRPFVDRFEMGKAAEKGGKEDGPGGGQVFAREPRVTEVAPKRSRKASKKFSS